MDTLVYFLVWAWLLIVVMRYERQAKLARQGRLSDSGAVPSSIMLKWVAPAEDWDPVCGNIVETRRARPTVHEGDVYYFCSRECREVFEAAPALYLQGAVNETHRQLPT